MKTVNEFYVFLTRFIFSFKETFLLFSSVLLNYFIYSRVNASYILYDGTIPVTPSLSFKLFITDPQEKSYLTNLFTIFQMLIEGILSPIAFVTEWTPTGL